MQSADLIRELEKAIEALNWAEKHLTTSNESAAALHCNSKVFYSPLTTQVHAAHESLVRVLADISPGAPLSPDLDRQHDSLAGVLLDLDRCEHGRHQSDHCFGCPGGQSSGNLLLPAGMRVGTDLYQQPITVPPLFCRTEPGAWRVPKENRRG